MKKIDSSKWLWIIGLPAIFSGFLLFYALYQSSAKSAAQTTQLIQAQLIYILSEKDDMELIDFGNFLKNSNPFLALSASSNGKIIISLGDLNNTPSRLLKPPGFYFVFPSHWVFHSITPLPESSGSQLDLSLSLPLVPNPWSWALLDILICLLMGTGIRILFLSKADVPLKKLETPVSTASPSFINDESTRISTSTSQTSQLRVDKGYLVKSASETAIALLEKRPDEILGHHILDLSPHPALLEIFKQAQNAKIQNAFLTPTPIKAEVINEEEGWLIVLEKAENGQKH